MRRIIAAVRAHRWTSLAVLCAIPLVLALCGVPWWGLALETAAAVAVAFFLFADD